jgi:hypothetical protein
MPFPGSSDLWGGGRSSLNQEREQSQTFPTPHLPQGDSSDCHCLLLGSVFCPGYVWVTICLCIEGITSVENPFSALSPVSFPPLT